MSIEKPNAPRALWPLMSIFLWLLFSGCATKEAKIQASLDAYTEQGACNGYLYISEATELLYDSAFQKGSENFTRLSKDDRLALASLSKLFTEVAILRMVDAQLIELDAKVIDYRPGFKATNAGQITIRQLLEMRSGLDRELNAEHQFQALSLDSNGLLGPYLDSLESLPMRAEPGAKEEYSNLTYWLLGAVLEAVGQANLDQVLEQWIFEGLEMHSSGWREGISSITKGYLFKREQWSQDPQDYSCRYASGGLYSSVADLAKLAKALHGDQFLSAESKAFLQKQDALSIYGSLPSSSHLILLDWQAELTIIMLQNLALEDLNRIPQFVAECRDVLDLTSAERPKRKVVLNSLESLADTVPLESALKEWLIALKKGNPKELFQILAKHSEEGSFNSDDPTWQALAELNRDYPDWKALGYRWIKGEEPGGLELWLQMNADSKMALLWIPSETNPNRIGNLFIRPDDMEWMGEKY
tara:strand:+ start:136 stop:1554 length:1419 start_codon:yes stop_codon:yes gene_type:complete